MWGSGPSETTTRSCSHDGAVHGNVAGTPITAVYYTWLKEVLVEMQGS